MYHTNVIILPYSKRPQRGVTTAKEYPKRQQPTSSKRAYRVKNKTRERGKNDFFFLFCFWQRWRETSAGTAKHTSVSVPQRFCCMLVFVYIWHRNQFVIFCLRRPDFDVWAIWTRELFTLIEMVARQIAQKQIASVARIQPTVL